VVGDASPVRAAARIQVPVLLIHGEQDPETPMSHSETVNAALVADKVLLIVKGGHCPSLDQTTWATVDSILDRVYPRAASEPNRPQ